jgi:hypothetical protein
VRLRRRGAASAERQGAAMTWASFVESVALKICGKPRRIWNREGTGLYLSRYYVWRKPVMPDGSEVFDEFGAPRKGAIWRGRFGLYVHRFHASDDASHLHSHPWKWSLSLVLSSGYVEERRTSIPLRNGARVVHGVAARRVRPFAFNFIRQDDYHRVDLIGGRPALTLFLVGPKTPDSSWYFWDRQTGEETPWREFVDSKRRA